MKIRSEIIEVLLAVGLLPVFSSCISDDMSNCEANFRLEYRYLRNGTLGENELGYYVGSMREYIFDYRDVLIAINDYNLPHDNSSFYSNQDFFPGKYTVITFGNETGYEDIDSAVIGETMKQEMLMRMNHPELSPDIANGLEGSMPTRSTRATEGIQGRSDRLYYGYRHFIVGGADLGRVTSMHMTHAHCVLDIRARWLDDTGHPAANKSYVLKLSHAPTLYRFMPEFLVHNGYDNATYSTEEEVKIYHDQRRINYIPQVVKTVRTTYGIKGVASNNGSENILYGQFVTYRYRGDTEIYLSIYSDGQQVMKEIDLLRFFQEMGINLHYSLCQEYAIQLDINGDEVKVSLMQVDKWEEGGDF